MASTSHLLRAQDLHTDDIIIAVFGATGAGKSTFIERLSNTTGISGDDLRSKTDSVQSLRARNPHIKRDIVLVDTPGFDDTYRSDMEVLQMLAKWLEETYQRNVKLTGIVFLHRISDNRFAGTPMRNLAMFGKLCGTNALSSVALVTTMWDIVKPEVGQKRQNELESRFWKELTNGGSQTHSFQPPTFDVAWKIVNTLIAHRTESHDAPVILLLQEELVDLKKQLGETAAGIELYRTLQELLQKQKQISAKLQKDAATGHSKELLEQQANVERLIGQTADQLREMKVPFLRRLLGMFSFKRARSRPVRVVGI